MKVHRPGLYIAPVASRAIRLVDRQEVAADKRRPIVDWNGIAYN